MGVAPADIFNRFWIQVAALILRKAFKKHGVYDVRNGHSPMEKNARPGAAAVCGATLARACAAGAARGHHTAHRQERGGRPRPRDTLN